MGMDHIDLLIGRIALERKLVTREQLTEALFEQAGEAEPSPLGQILVRRGHLKPADLDGLLAEQKRRIGEAFELTDAKLEDALLGRLLVRQGLLTEKQLYECLREQASQSEQGQPAPRLGELLVRRRMISTDAASALLGPERQTALFCSACGTRYRTASYDPAETYSCKKCRHRLLPAPDDTTTGLLPASRSPLPEDVVEAMKDPVNRTEDGRYVRVKEIGRGGMGVVWKAWQADLERYVAIKQMTPALWSESEQRRFLREAQTAARLSHPNIATIYEVGVQEGKHYIAMEFVDGDPLSAFTTGLPGTSTRTGEAPRRTGKHLPLRHALEVLREAADAVEYAHSKGVIHRDLKPDNLMLARGGGRVYVMDFGLAKPVQGKDGITLGDSILGTPQFMSPEQARGDAVDRRTDVYSLGAVLYFLLAGRPPFHAASPAETLMQVLTDEPAPPRAHNPGVPPDLERICLKALEKDRHRRYESARALSADLGRYLRGEPVRARRTLGRERLMKWIRERPGRVSAASAVAGIALFVAAFFWAAESRTRVEIGERMAAAEEHLRAENFPRALAEYQAVLHLDPRHAEAEAGKRKVDQLLREGRASLPEFRREADRLFEQGRFGPALALYERVIRVRPEPAAEERARRCRAELQREAETAADVERRAREGDAGLRDRRERDEARRGATPHFLAAVESLAATDRLRQRGAPLADVAAQLSIAEAAASRALQQDAGYLEARVLRAQLRHRLGDHAGALEDFKEAIDAAPWNRQASFGRAYTALVRWMIRREAPFLREGEDLETLERDFEDAVSAAAEEYSSDAFERWAVMALQEFVARRTPKAAERLRTIELEGRAQPSYHFVLACLELEVVGSSESRFDVAAGHLGRLLELDPFCLEGLFLRAALRSRSGDRKGALEDAERLVSAAPQAPWALIVRAQAQKLHARYEAALKDLEKAVELDAKLAPGLKREIAELQRLK